MLSALVRIIALAVATARFRQRGLLITVGWRVHFAHVWASLFRGVLAAVAHPLVAQVEL